MRNEANAGVQADGRDVPLGAERLKDDPVLEHWLQIAACAWEGFLLVGPGFVFICEEDGEFFCEYRSRLLCTCCPIVGEDDYDPYEQVVVFVHELQVVGGSPTPPDANEMVTAGMQGAVLH
jgi:hypothetical protein